MKGFTLIETILAMMTISLISVSAIYILFLSLSLRDTTLASSKIEESLRVFDHSLRQSVIGAVSITGNASELYVRSQTICSSYVYDSDAQILRYSRIEQDGCVPDPNPQNSFFPESLEVLFISFMLSDIQTGGRQVGLSGRLQIVLPFDTYVRDFSNTYINLVD